MPRTSSKSVKMKNIIITRSQNSPRICLEPETGQISIIGRSTTCYTKGVYEPVISQISTQFKNLSSIELNLSLVHLNTSSRRWICEIFGLLKEFQRKGSVIKVVWNYESDDIDMLEAGEDYEMIHELDFEYNAIHEDEFYKMLVAV